MLNCKDQKHFQEVYEKTIERHFSKMVRQPVPVLEAPRQELSQVKEEDYSALA